MALWCDTVLALRLTLSFRATSSSNFGDFHAEFVLAFEDDQFCHAFSLYVPSSYQSLFALYPVGRLATLS